jgi:hypothetical protein
LDLVVGEDQKMVLLVGPEQMVEQVVVQVD